MKKILFAIAFVMMMVIANAQSDGWFRSGNDSYNNRTTDIEDAINNSTPGGHGIETDPAPLGSGLIILGALGAGYAVARRKK